MVPLFCAITVIGLSVEGLLLWRLLKHDCLRRYPYFSAFVLCDLACNLILIAVASLHRESLIWTYWAANVFSVFANFLIIWEVVRVLFPIDSPLRRIARSVLLGFGLLAVPAILALDWDQANVIHFSYTYVPPSFEQYLTLFQAVLLLTVACVARYYRLRLGRNLRGLVFGLGLYLLLCAANFATLQIVPGFFPYLQFLSPTLYVVLIAFWLWSFWEYAPSGGHPAEHFDDAQWKAQWDRLWLSTTSLVRRGHN